MKRLLTLLALSSLVAACSPSALADVPAPGNPTPVQQVGSNNTAGSTCVNAQAASGSATTLTINSCGNGQYQYFTYLEFDLISNAAATTANTYAWTTTNFGSLQFDQAITATAGAMATPIIISAPPALKAPTPGVAVTFTGAASVTNLIEAARACYYCDP